MDKPAKKGSVDILTILGGSPAKDSEEPSMDSAKLALKAAFRAVKEDDFDGFAEAMAEWMSCDHEEKSETSDIEE